MACSVAGEPLLHPARRDRGFLRRPARRSHRARARALAPPAAVRGDAAGLAGADGRDPRVEGPSPFGRLLNFAFDHSDLALGFRTTYKAGAGLMLAIAVLLGVGVAAAVGRSGAAVDPRSPPARRRDSRATARAGPRPAGVRRRGRAGRVLPVLDRSPLPRATGSRAFRGTGIRPSTTSRHRSSRAACWCFPATNMARYRWGNTSTTASSTGSRPSRPLINRSLPQGTAESADLVAAIDEYVEFARLRQGHARADPRAARRAVGGAAERPRLAADGSVPRPSTYDALRDDPGLRLAATFGRRGLNTASRGRSRVPVLLGERSLPPVELYEVAGGALAAAPAGGRAHPSWSRAPATPGPRWRPPGCWTGRPSPTPEPRRTTSCERWSPPALSWW